MARLLELVTLFFIVFDPQVPFLPNGVGFSLILFFVLAPKFFVLLLGGRLEFVIKKAMPLFFCFFLALVIILVRLLMSGGDNIEFILSWFKASILFFAVFLFFCVFYSARTTLVSEKRFLSNILIVYSFNAVINFIAGSFPEWFQFLSMFRSEVVSDSLGGNPYRNSFVSGSGYFSIGTAYGLIVLLCSFYFVKHRVISATGSSALVLVAIAGFVAARTSFFGAFLAVLYFFIGRPLYLIFLGVLALALLSFILLLPALQPYVIWMQSFFSEFSSSSSASYLLEEMYFWPGSDIFLYGSGVVNNGTFVYTDAGYMQDILFGGILFLLVKLLFVLVLFLVVSRVSFVFACFFVVAVLLFHMKGLFIYNNAQGMAAFYLAYFYFSLFGRQPSTMALSECARG